MKNKKKFFIILIISVAAVLALGAVFFIILHNHNSNTPENAIQQFYNSMIPDYDAEKLEQSVGTDVYKIRFDDNGYFVDRYERTRKQLVYYYGEDFRSTLSEFVVAEVSDASKASTKKEYLSKYSLEIEDMKRVSFTVTLSSDVDEKSRTETITTLKINGKWLVYDYDAYWFAYM